MQLSQRLSYMLFLCHTDALIIFMGKLNISFDVYFYISNSWNKEIPAHITQRNNLILVIFQELLVSNKPGNGLLGHNDFCSLQSSSVTWHVGMPRHPRARGCEKQIVNPEKARNATKDKVQLSTPPVKASNSPPFCHPFTTQNQPNLLVAGDSLDCSYGLMCYTAGYYIAICLC